MQMIHWKLGKYFPITKSGHPSINESCDYFFRYKFRQVGDRLLQHFSNWKWTKLEIIRRLEIMNNYTDNYLLPITKITDKS